MAPTGEMPPVGEILLLKRSLYYSDAWSRSIDAKISAAGAGLGLQADSPGQPECGWPANAVHFLT